jgi:Flp pilus assembly protein CpaB
MDSRTRTRLLLLVAFVIVVAAVGIVLLMGGGDAPPAVEIAQEPDAPVETAVPTELAATPIPTQELVYLVVAVQNISRGQTITPDSVELRPWPYDALPFSRITDPEDVIGRIARIDLVPENPVLSSMIVDSLDQISPSGSDMAAMMPPGTVGVVIPIDRLSSVAYAPVMGDSVDLIASFLFSDMDEEFGSALPNMVNLISSNFSISEDGPSSLTLSVADEVQGRFDTRRIPLPVLDIEGGRLRVSTSLLDYPVVIRPQEDPRPRLLTHRVILDARVMWTGDSPRDGIIFKPIPSPTPVGSPVPQQPQQAPQQEFPTLEPPRPATITLAVSPQDAVIMYHLLEYNVPLNMVLRPAADRSRRQTDQVTLDYIISQYDITIPRRNDYGLEPAIRSIRQMMVTDRIQLGSN